MTLQVNANFINQLFNGFLQAATLGTSTNYKLEIFKSTIPEVDGNFTYNSADYAADRLASYGAGSFNLQISGRTLRFGTQTPAPANASATGTATWFALSNGGSSTYQSNAILGTITDQVDGSGVLILENVNLVQGNPINVIEIGVRVF